MFVHSPKIDGWGIPENIGGVSISVMGVWLLSKIMKGEWAVDVESDLITGNLSGYYVKHSLLCVR